MSEQQSDVNREIAGLEIYIAHVKRRVDQATDERKRVIRRFVLLMAQGYLKRLKEGSGE